MARSSQGPESEPLLSNRTEQALPVYLDSPELEQSPEQPPDLNMGFPAAHRESAVELASPQDVDMHTTKTDGRKGDSLGLGLIFGGCTLLVVVTWFVVLSNHPTTLGLFAFHPTLQTLSITLFAYGLVTLQTTSQLNPKAKAAGLNRHQLIILGLAFPCIAVGTLVIIWNKNIHDKPHFVTWHGTFGIMSIVWMFLQMFLGAGSVWYNGKLFGGGAKAKGVWKYHRLSGYLLFPFFLVTIVIAGGWSGWSANNLSKITRIFTYGLAPLAILIGLWSRARLSKMKFF